MSGGVGQAHIEVLMAGENRLHRESLLETDQGRLSHTLRQERVTEDSSNRVRHRTGIPRRDQESCLAIDDRLGDAADIGGDDRDTLAHCLEDHQRQALDLRCKHENVGGSEQLPRLGERSREEHGTGEPQGIGATANAGEFWTIPGEHRMDAGELPDERRHGR